MIEVRFKKMHPDAVIPTRSTEEAAGMDLYALEDTYLLHTTKIRTGLAVEIPKGLYGKVEARSGLSFNYDIETGAGVIDSDYRGEIKVKMYCFSKDGHPIKKGDRIAQLIVQPYIMCNPIESDDLSTDTQRGENGFGSSGL